MMGVSEIFRKLYTQILACKMEIIYTTLLFSVAWSVLLSFGLALTDQVYIESTNEFTVMNLSWERFLDAIHQNFRTENIAMTVLKRSLISGAIGFIFSLLAMKFRNHVVILPIFFGTFLFLVFTVLYLTTADSPVAITSINQVKYILFTFYFPTQLCCLLVFGLWYRGSEN
jgi:hypothetical protein